MNAATGATGAAGAAGATGTAETITVRNTNTGEPDAAAAVVDVTGSPDHVLDFIIPRGATGATGETGPTGAAATIRVGAVITGDPGTEAQVYNTGTDEDAVFDFVIPRGEPGGGGAPEVLATVDPNPQTSVAGGALIFTDTPLISGASITHAAGSSQVVIYQPGIYQAVFNGTATVDAGVSIPATLLAQLTLNGADVPGAVARHTFSATGEESTIAFDVPFRVDTVPSTLEVVANESGFTFRDISLTVHRLGDAT